MDIVSYLMGAKSGGGGGSGTKKITVADPQEVTVSLEQEQGPIKLVDGYEISPISGMPTNWTVTVDGIVLSVDGTGQYSYTDETSGTTYLVGADYDGTALTPFLLVTDSSDNTVPGTYTVAITAIEIADILVCHIDFSPDFSSAVLDKTWLEVANAPFAVLSSIQGFMNMPMPLVLTRASGNGDGSYTYSAVFEGTEIQDSGGTSSYTPNYLTLTTSSATGYPSMTVEG